MRSTQQLSITLPVEMARLVKDKVSSGAYASESEVIREGLRALQERDAVVERWLMNVVAPTYDRVVADPAGTTISAKDLQAGLTAHMRAAKKAGAK